MSFTPFNAPLLSQFLGDNEIAGFFSVKAELAAMAKFQTALAHTLAGLEIIPKEVAGKIDEVATTFQPDMGALSASSARDGLIIPEYVRQLKAAVGDPYGAYVHYGSTSQDVIDTSLMMRLSDLQPVLLARLQSLSDQLKVLNEKHGKKPMDARTRMKIALPINVEDRLGLWQRPLSDAITRLHTLGETGFYLQFAGAVGTLHKYEDKGAVIRAEMAKALGLHDPGHSWHTDRQPIMDFASALMAISTVLAKIGTDIVLMAQDERSEIKLEGLGGSSAMAHKENPVLAESLQSLHQFNVSLMGALYNSSVHEQERSGIAWTQEWMIIPQLCVTTGAALRNAKSLIGAVLDIGDQ